MVLALWSICSRGLRLFAGIFRDGTMGMLSIESLEGLGAVKEFFLVGVLRAPWSGLF